MIRRSVLCGACAAVLLTAAWASAVGGGVRVLRAGTGPIPRVGHAWTLKLAVRPASFRGVVRVFATGPARVAARAVRNGGYRARLLFPSAGRWRLTARAGGTRSSLGSIRVLAAAPLVLDQPTGIAVQPDGSLLVVEFGRTRLVRVVPSSGQVEQIAKLAKPWGVARAASGSVFVSDQNRVERIDPGHAPVTVASIDPSLEVGPVRSRRPETSSTRPRPRSIACPPVTPARHSSSPPARPSPVLTGSPSLRTDPCSSPTRATAASSASTATR